MPYFALCVCCVNKLWTLEKIAWVKREGTPSLSAGNGRWSGDLRTDLSHIMWLSFTRFNLNLKVAILIKSGMVVLLWQLSNISKTDNTNVLKIRGHVKMYTLLIASIFDIHISFKFCLKTFFGFRLSYTQQLLYVIEVKANIQYDLICTNTQYQRTWIGIKTKKNIFFFHFPWYSSLV